MSITILSPKVDFVFKKIFGSEENKSVLISFLNAVLKDEKEKIKSVEINNTDIEKEFSSDKFSRLDIKAKTDRNEIINIEIQLKNRYNMIKRSLYYWSMVYEEQIVESEDYSILNKTICINILDFKYLNDEENFHNVYRLRNTKTNNELTDICEIHFIEIPKLRKLEVGEENEMLEIWTEFLRNPESEVVREVEQIDKEVKKAKDKLCVMSQNDKERELYFLRQSAIRDEISAISFAKNQGIEQGREEGREEGRAEGEENKAKEIALNLIKQGLDEKTIAQITNLDIEIIKKLR